MIDALYGVNVVDEGLYAEYRARMTPILSAHDGRFVLDVRVAEVLRSPEAKPFNRLFTIRFASRERLRAFFSHPGYMAVRKSYFEPAVTSVVELGNYELPST